MQKKKILIVGAGGSGLPAIRHGLLYEKECDITCLEASDSIGGLWRYKPKATEWGSVMKSTVINTSKEMSAYSDCPPAAEMANFMHNTQMYKYMWQYVEKFELLNYIKFNHRVKSIERSKDFEATGKWTVIYTDQTGGEHTEDFDGVLLCSGHHVKPNFPPSWPGQEKFKGKIIHSHDYKDHRGLEDKTVVVVGIGNSGGDVAVELSRIAKQVYLSTRRGSWIINRIFDQGVPVDIALNTRFNKWLMTLIPESLSNTMFEKKLNARFDHEIYGLKPKHRVFSAHPTVNDELPNRIACGTVLVRGQIQKFTETDVEFEEGFKASNVDLVVMSTGYKFDFPLVEKGTLIPVKDNKTDLYKYMYPLETAKHNSLAVIGLVQPFGSIMPISEMQTRLFYENLLHGNTIVPSKNEMRADIDMKHCMMEQQFVKSPRHTIQVDYVTYMDELAKLLDCVPRISDYVLKDPLLAYKLLTGPNVPYVYRLRGPNAIPREARYYILDVERRIKIGTNAREKTLHAHWVQFPDWLPMAIFLSSLIFLVYVTMHLT